MNRTEEYMLIGSVPGPRSDAFCMAARKAWHAGEYPDFHAAQVALAPRFISDGGPATPPATPSTPKTPRAEPAPKEEMADEPQDPRIAKIIKALRAGDIDAARELFKNLSDTSDAVAVVDVLRQALKTQDALLRALGTGAHAKPIGEAQEFDRLMGIAAPQPRGVINDGALQVFGAAPRNERLDAHELDKLMRVDRAAGTAGAANRGRVVFNAAEGIQYFGV